MTLIPPPIYTPFRRFEIVTGLVCIGVAVWSLLQLLLWFAGGETVLVVDSAWSLLLLGVEVLFLLGFGGGLVSSGYISMFFWLLAVYVVINLQLTVRVFG